MITEKQAISLLKKYGCSEDVITHCKTVARYGKEIAANIKNADTELVYIGGLLHDIGRSKTHDITHAVEGAKIAIENNLDSRLVNIIERHIGAGILKSEAKKLGLPVKDYVPLTLEEKIVAHADNLVSGSKVVSIEEQVEKLRKKNVDENIIKRIVLLNDEIAKLYM